MKTHRMFLYSVTGVFLLLSSAGFHSSAAGMQETGHAKPQEGSLAFFAKQEVTLHDFQAEGLILDIGGGGEGIIGRLKGEQVVAIDINKRELEDAPSGPLKLVMDARDLMFLDESFATATVFFTFMYIDGADHEKVFTELHRVLKPGGRLLIWDVVLNPSSDPKRTMAAFPLHIKLPDRDVQTGYGVKFPKSVQDSAYYTRLAQEAGFTVTAEKERDLWFFMELKK